MAEYKDDLANGYVNGYYVGVQVGTKMEDKLADPNDDGYDVVRGFNRQGTVMPDAVNPGVPEPLVEEEAEPDPEPDPEEEGV